MSLEKYRDATDWTFGLNHVTTLLGHVGGRKILDIGVGSARYAQQLANQGAAVVGTDRTQSYLERWQQGPIHYVCADGASCLAQESADSVVATFSLCEMPQDVMAQTAVDVALSLKQGGSFVLCEPHPDSPGYEFYSNHRELHGPKREGTPVTVRLRGTAHTFHDYWHAESTYREVLRDAGLTVTALREPMWQSAGGIWQAEREQPPYLLLRAEKR
ncbi:MAG: class I SAM-dependent methyltransferase [Candidatus Woesearchaeota archaeon]|nr:class I SAM-dependent methyltransferase [Candidatus Woesearchaeota archaeon]